ncbi:MAG: baseplate J/gp47 family protein [Prevotella sp.]|nr:baseplate J/gp47 family protein [Prevotella sp.]
MANEYYDYITETGVIVPDTETILSELQSMMTGMFGLEMDLSPETPQGRLIEMWSRNREFCIQICAMVSNLLNLNKASGFVLDDLGALFLLSRKEATYTRVTVMLGGVDGTIVPAHTRLRTEGGDIFVNDRSVTIVDGSAQVEYRAEKTGPVPCPAGTLNIILDSVNGLETANNPWGPISVGQELESDNSFRLRIKSGLNVNSIAILTAIKSNLESLDGVIGTYCYDNYTNDAVIIDGLELGPHSLLAVVDGGNADDIAKVLYSKKTLGTGYVSAEDNPNYTILEKEVIDDAYGSIYKVSFARPIMTDVDIMVTVSRKNYTGENLEQAVKTAIFNFVNGENPEVDGITIGGPLSPFEISAAISSEIPEIFIREVKVGEHGGSLSAETMTFGYLHKANILDANITVVIQL